MRSKADLLRSRHAGRSGLAWQVYWRRSSSFSVRAEDMTYDASSLLLRITHRSVAFAALAAATAVACSSGTDGDDGNGLDDGAGGSAFPGFGSGGYVASGGFGTVFPSGGSQITPG